MGPPHSGHHCIFHSLELQLGESAKASRTEVVAIFVILFCYQDIREVGKQRKKGKP
jgi:hypothetical protein